MMYFYQSLSQILFTKGLNTSSQFENILLLIFNFDILLSSSSSTTTTTNGICMIAKISSGLHEILISYLFYLFLFYLFY